MEKTVYTNANRIIISGCLTKDAQASEKVAHFRILHNTVKDKAPVGFDCVMFPNEKRGIPADLLKKGAKVIVTGHFHVNTRPSTKEEGKTYSSLELVVDAVEENVPKTVTVDEPVSVTLEEDAPVEDMPEFLQ